MLGASVDRDSAEAVSLSLHNALCTSSIWPSVFSLGKSFPNKPIHINKCFLDFCESLELVIKHQEGLWLSFIHRQTVRSPGDNLGCAIGAWSRGKSWGIECLTCAVRTDSR